MLPRDCLQKWWLNSRTGRTLQNGNYYHLGPRPGLHSPSMLNGHLGHGPDSPYHTTLSVPLSQGLQPGYDSAQVHTPSPLTTSISCTISIIAREETNNTTITFINMNSAINVRMLRCKCFRTKKTGPTTPPWLACLIWWCPPNPWTREIRLTSKHHKTTNVINHHTSMSDLMVTNIKISWPYFYQPLSLPLHWPLPRPYY